MSYLNHMINRTRYAQIFALTILTIALLISGCNSPTADYELYQDPANLGPYWVVTSYSGENKDPVIPSSKDDLPISIIGIKAFKGAIIQSIDVGFVSEIWDEAFFMCTSLKKVNLREVKVIASEAFRSCVSLEDVIIPSTVTSIGDLAFQRCVKLKNVYFLSNPNVLSARIFENCPHITLYAPPGGTVEAYAKANNLPFHPLPDEIPA